MAETAQTPLCIQCKTTRTASAQQKFCSLHCGAAAGEAAKKDYSWCGEHQAWFPYWAYCAHQLATLPFARLGQGATWREEEE